MEKTMRELFALLRTIVTAKIDNMNPTKMDIIQRLDEAGLNCRVHGPGLFRSWKFLHCRRPMQSSESGISPAVKITKG